jgi:hypothetical protein
MPGIADAAKLVKRRGLERVERRRALVELNLISETKPNLKLRRRGCLARLVPGLLLVAVLAAHSQGLL